MGLQSAHNTSSLLLVPPHSLPLLHCGVPTMGYSPLPAAPTWVFTTGCSPSGTDCSSVSCSPHGTVHASSLLLCWFSMGCSFLQATSICCDVVFFTGCSLEICSDAVLAHHRASSALGPGAPLPLPLC